MNDEAKTVLWLGLFMIAFGIVKQWPQISSLLFSGGSSGSGGLGANALKAQKYVQQHSVTGTVTGSRL